MVTGDSLWLPSSSSGGWKNQWILVSLICVSGVLGFMFQHQQKLHTDMRVKHKHCKYARDTDKTQTLQTCTRYWRNTNTANMHEIQTKQALQTCTRYRRNKHCKHARDTDETPTLQTSTRYRQYGPPEVLHYVYFSNTDLRYSTVLLVIKVNKSESYVHVPDDLSAFIHLPKVAKYE